MESSKNIPSTIPPPKCPLQLIIKDQVVACPYYWQVPAATEKAAFDSIIATHDPLFFKYIGFPWATLIDGLRGEATSVGPLLMALKEITQLPMSGNRVTVAQHIHALQFFELFKAVGITDLFYSHATHKQYEIDGIRIHPFPLFPAQTPNLLPEENIDYNRKYLANFIGAFNPSIYLSNVRELIFKDADKYDDLLIIKRDSWHFDRAVYDEQIKGLKPDEQLLQVEAQHTNEYLSAIKNSWFTLCPTGSGPNSIRIFESLCVGSIPIILTRDLRLPGPPDLWKKAAIIEKDSEEGYANSLIMARELEHEQKIEKILAGRKLIKLVEPRMYYSIIDKMMSS